MRKHDVRKWLHAVLDLLPVLVIPLFMIYSSNKNYQSNISITQDVDRQVDFNQRIVNGNFEEETWAYHGCDVSYENNTIRLYNFSSTYPEIVKNVPLTLNHYYLVKVDSMYANSMYINYDGQNGRLGSLISDQTVFTTNYLKAQYTTVKPQLEIFVISNQLTYSEVILKNLCLFDLTQMFGEGNEPSIQDFVQWFPNDYYEYTLSTKITIENYDTIVYDETDVGSQMFYTLYNTVDKYFNMGDVFGLNGVYDWFVFNIFGGNFSPAIYVVWQVVLYEFVMDLLFLLYGLFMWFIDMVEHLMEKPFKSIK